MKEFSHEFAHCVWLLLRRDVEGAVGGVVRSANFRSSVWECFEKFDLVFADLYQIACILEVLNSCNCNNISRILICSNFVYKILPYSCIVRRKSLTCTLVSPPSPV